jgi:hypothetical protein
MKQLLFYNLPSNNILVVRGKSFSLALLTKHFTDALCSKVVTTGEQGAREGGRGGERERENMRTLAVLMGQTSCHPLS